MTKKKYFAYIASGWFTKTQEKDLVNIEKLLMNLGVKYFSPKREFLITKTSTSKNIEDCFKMNLRAIKNSECVIVNTRGKDLGTIFESGYAYANKVPIIYCFFSKKKFNIMLLSSSIFVARNIRELAKALISKDIKLLKANKKNWIGKVE